MKHFPPFRFNPRTRVLWRTGLPVHLSRKAVELLDCLLNSPGTMVSHDEILQRVWRDTHVQPENVKTVVHELRNALGDQSHAFIRSEPGRGYTFISDVTVGMPPLYSDEPGADETHLTGRETELDVLMRHVEAAADKCEPQLVLVEGDRGTGKTTLCDAFARNVRFAHQARISHATGVEAWGTAERYSVLTDALGLLGRQYPHLVPGIVNRRAPGWLPRFPSWRHALSGNPATSDADAQTTDERLCRELIAALDELTVDVPLLVILENLQWADIATIEFLRLLARGQRPGRLCVIATFCASTPTPAVDRLERLARDLRTVRCASLVRLWPFTPTQVLHYVEHRFDLRVAKAIALPLFEAGGGNPQLAVTTLDTLVRLGVLHTVEGGWRLSTPADQFDAVLQIGLTEALQTQIDRLSIDDYAIVEAAATQGVEFTADAVAEALGVARPMIVRRRLASLAERHLLVKPIDGDWRAPGAAAVAFKFRHPVTMDLMLDRIPLKSRMRGAAPADQRRATAPRRA
jgi:DNA-binding winged helix-turn-helix (wHTH) protein